jgi:hypothetical protein
MGPRILTCIVLMALPMVAAWKRHVITPEDDRIDHPAPHALSYFTRYPLLRTEYSQVCWGCTPTQKTARAKATKAKAEVSLVGKVAGFAIYDVITHFEEEGSTTRKFILVQTGPDRFREIYHLEPNQWDSRIERSVVVEGSGDSFLRTRDWVGGNGGYTYEEYYWLDGNGPHPIDLSPVKEAAAFVVPSDIGQSMGPQGADWSNPEDLAKSIFSVPVVGKNLRCCSGFVHVRFRVEHGRIIVLGATYNAEAEH